MRGRILVLTVALVVAGCGGSTSGVPLVLSPTEATPTELATESATQAPVDTPTPPDGPTPKPTKKPSYYTPPGWDGVSDVNCKDFKTHAQAVSFFKGTGGTASNDPYGLDSNHDGNPCQTLP